MSDFRRLFLLSIFLGCLTGLLAATRSAAKAAAKSPTSLGTYAGAIVTDAATGQVLFEDHADIANPPASMTKLMTFAVLSDKLADGTITLTTPVRVTAEDASKGGTQVYLDPRETFPVEELIYAMMIQSANDAANALARAAAGSAAAFVELMNAKAKAIGMTHTTFRTPHGLPPAGRRLADSDMSTPRDYAILCRYLLQHTNGLKYSSVKQRDFGTGVRPKPQEMINHNKLLGKIPGVDGLKTGYTESAGYCISVTAERNGRRLIVVVMGAFGHNRSIDKGQARDLKTIELLDRGFASLPAAPAVLSKPTAPAAAAAAAPAEIPAVNMAPSSTGQKSSPAKEPEITFRVIPPSKNP